MKGRLPLYVNNLAGKGASASLLCDSALGGVRGLTSPSGGPADEAHRALPSGRNQRLASHVQAPSVVGNHRWPQLPSVQAQLQWDTLFLS